MQRNVHGYDLAGLEQVLGAGLDGLRSGGGAGDFYSNPEKMFRSTGLPMPDLMSADQLRGEADKLRQNVILKHNALFKILERHEATIQKRWIKKTRSQRLAILLKCWPNMAATHRPDFKAAGYGRNRAKLEGKAQEEAFMWPYINQEDLSKTRTLPLLLNARGRHHPCLFAAADYDHMRIGIVSMKLNRAFLNGWTMILNGDPDSPTIDRDFGSLVNWDDNDDAFDWMHTQTQFAPGDGLAVLRAQRRLLEFLMACCVLILHDIPPEEMYTFPVLPEPVLKQDAEGTGFDSLAIMATEAPYRVPAHIDFDRIVSLLAAQTSASADHLLSLREDPAYFSYVIKDVREHRQEMLPDSNGDVHPTREPFRAHLLWARSLRTAVLCAYTEFEFFSMLLDQARELRSLQEKYAHQIKPGNPLPKEYLRAILKFQLRLKEVSTGILRQVQTVSPAAPTIRHLFMRQPPPDKSSTMIAAMMRDIKRTPLEDKLIVTFKILMDNGEHLRLMSMPAVMDDLERLIESDPEAKGLITAHLASVVGMLSVISQCMTQINLYQPWANGFENALMEMGAELEDELLREHQPLAIFLNAFQDDNFHDAGKLYAPTGDRYAYPYEKRRTKENTEILRKAEATLDGFWRFVDRMSYAKAGNLKGTASRVLLTQPRIMQRTPEWVDPAVPTDKAAAKTKTAAPVNKAAAVGSPLSDFYFGLLEKPSQGRQTATAKTKAKTKTRGTAAISEPDLSTLSIEEPEPVNFQPAVAVDARALKVFRTIFFNPNVSSTPGEVPWKDFLHAMASTGFQAEKLYGSVWQFQPTNLDVERSIQFHEPHPRGKMTYEVARRVGRRLNRAYGWSGDMFELKKATDKADASTTEN